MATIAEFHLLQNFAPSNLNRDDTGAPKDAVFGGVRRARISSQCVKRAVRLQFKRAQLLTDAELGARTLRIASRIAEMLKTDKKRTEADEHVGKAIASALEHLGLKVKKKEGDAWGRTEYLLFLGDKEIEALSAAIDAHFPEWATGKAGKEAKKAVDDSIGAARAVDVALFGRMLADRKDFNVDAAAQVAHAISTHRVDRDVDFFTAVDDFAGQAEAVSGMLGTVEFNSSCFYRYAVVNLDLLHENLADDGALVRKAVEAFLRGIVTAVPSGKQNTFAAHNPPDFVGVVIRQGAPINLSNAFEKPVASSESSAGLTAASVARLKARWDLYAKAFDVDASAMQTMDLTGQWPGVASVNELAAAVMGRYDRTPGG